MNRYCFLSNRFKPVVDEDENTNPGIYGQELSEWLAEKLKNTGYAVKEIVPEDWGWCIVLDGFQRYFFWVGCNGEYYDDKLIWSCFVGVDEPFFANPFKKADKDKIVQSIESEVLKILTKNFSLIACP